MYNVDPASVRGEHAHKHTWQFLIAVKGSFRLTLADGTSKRELIMSPESGGVVVPPGIWCELSSFKQDAICLVAASHPYAPEDYIADWHEFEVYKQIF